MSTGFTASQRDALLHDMATAIADGRLRRLIGVGPGHLVRLGFEEDAVAALYPEAADLAVLIVARERHRSRGAVER